MATEAGPYCRKTIGKLKGLDDGIRWSAESIVKNTVLEGHAHGDTRHAMRNDDGFGWGAESIVKQTVLEAHAHGDTPGRSHNESEGQNWQIFGVLTTTKNNTRNGPNRTIWDHFWVGQRRGDPLNPILSILLRFLTNLVQKWGEQKD